MAELFAMKTPSGQLDPETLKYPVLCQPKLDGIRGICIKDSAYGDKGCRWFSFSGKPLWNLEFVTSALPKGDTAVYDGEIIWPGHTAAETNGLIKRQTVDLKKHPNHAQEVQELRFYCFDYMSLMAWESKVCNRPYSQRAIDVLSTLYSEKLNITAMGIDRAENPSDLEKLYGLYLASGYEGLMAKQPDGLYHWKRHPDWHRYKPTITTDVEVLGAYEEEDKNGVAKGTLGGIIIRVPAEDGYPEAICKCGGGFKAKERKEWWKPDWTIKWDNNWPKVTRVGGSPLIGHIVEVVSKERNKKSGALREPHFVRERPDKD